MNPRIYSSLLSAAYGNRFECAVAEAEIGDAAFFSVSHPNEVGACDDGEELLIVSLLNGEGLKGKFPELAAEEGLAVRHPRNDLTGHMELLGRIFRAAAELPPDEAAAEYGATEKLAAVKARLGQHRYKTKQAELWGNACAVTGLGERALLRASHAKPWREASAAERLDPENGLTLAVHLDALFDAGLIAFGDDGGMLISPELEEGAVRCYGLSGRLRLRKAPTAGQRVYLAYHRQHVFRTAMEVLGC